MDRKLITLISASVALAAIVAIVLIAGGDSGDKSSTTATTASEDNLGKKPTIAASDAPAPTTLQVEDIKVGEGPAAKAGDNLTMQYVGAIYDTGKEFDASWDRGQPFKFQLGAGNVIKGWDQGIVGMKAGGRRKLIIPADLGYGAAGSPPTIPANATLVFIVDLISIN